MELIRYNRDLREKLQTLIKIREAQLEQLVKNITELDTDKEELIGILDGLKEQKIELEQKLRSREKMIEQETKDKKILRQRLEKCEYELSKYNKK